MQNRNRKFIRRILAAGILFAACSLGGMAGTCFAADEIYVAGIPDSWPLEYYDKSSEGYDGVLTDMLKMASEQTGISIQYVNPGETDERLNLAKNVQVDAVWTLGLSEKELDEAGLKAGKIQFAYEEQGERNTVSLAYTGSMPAGIQEKLEKALAETDREEFDGRLIQYARSEREELRISAVVKYLSLAFLGVALTALLVMPVKLIRRKRQIEKLAYRDDITGRDNFAVWKQKFADRITDGNREHYSVLYMNAGLEEISHIYGYGETQKTLKLISDAIAPLVDNDAESFARFNDFYFVFFLQYTSVANIKERVLKFHQEVEARMKEEKKKYFLELHTGIYRLGTSPHEEYETLQFSAIAMEYARNNYIYCAVYDEFVEQETIRGYAMEHEAIYGLMNEEFLMYLQPLVKLEDGTICGAEALVRWQNPHRGLLRPESFMKVIKKKRLTGKMNMEIYRQGCRFLYEAAKKGNRLRLMFNFTVENVGDEQFVTHLEAIADQYEIDRSQIIIQLNQMVEMSRSERFMETIRKLRSLGFDICMAGLELDRVFFDYLECGINGIKLRHDLIRRLKTPEGKKVVEGVIHLCRDLNLEVFSIGIENKEEEQFLKEQGCNIGSGFYYHYPVSTDVFSELLEKKPGQRTE
ncbi:EAL domain-containing protein [uncultured Clostridium sp.]|uniref:EAL domain-containing protein n=1 Tax=uncultured Clostridium sp. TaxID=59620 RepID=UPI0025D79FB1|nr:EAL domain-containing protein [uncultured Clostridium sp.]